MNRKVYSSHNHKDNTSRYCRYCEVDKAWNYKVQLIIPTPCQRSRTVVLCALKHTCVLSDAELMRGCPICRLADPTIHPGGAYISRAANLTRHTCAECQAVYFAKYGAEKLTCAEGHALLSDSDSVRINVIAALEAVIGQTADDWFLHYYTDFPVCAMGYKVAAFIGTQEEYACALDAAGITTPGSMEYSMEKIIDVRFPQNQPYLWLCVRIDPTYAHDFEACAGRFLEATNLHPWLRENRRQDIPAVLEEYRQTGRKLRLDTVRPEWPAPKLLPKRRPQ